MSTEYVTENLLITAIEASDSFNCRGKINPIEVADLATDIAKNGLMQPVVVGPIQANGKRLLVAGYRRYTAMRINNETHIPVLIRDDLQDKTALLMTNMRENIQRQDLDIIQEANTIQRFLDYGLDEPAIMRELNMKRGWVQLRCMVCKLPTQLYPSIKDGTITAINIRELYSSMLQKTPEAFAEDVRWVKEKRAMGGKAVSLKKRDEAKEKSKGAKLRARSEINEMQSRIQGLLGGTHIAAAALGWASGHLPQETFEQMLERQCERSDVDYTPPAEG